MRNQLIDIKQQIADDKLLDALNALTNFIEDDSQLNELIIQIARLNELGKQLRIGSISNEDSNITKNKIRVGVLELINQIERKTNGKNIATKPTVNLNIKSLIKISLVIFSLIVIGYIVIINSKKTVEVSGEIDAKNSPIMIGNDNTIILNSEPKRDSTLPPNVNIRTNRIETDILSFSISSTKGLHEILNLYVEIIALYECDYENCNGQVEQFNNYAIPLIQDLKTIKLLPSTFSNSEDTWILKENDIDLFKIEFGIASNLSADIIINVEVLEHSTGKKYLSSSEIFAIWNLQCFCADRNAVGGNRTSVKKQLKEYKLNISPYLHKLLFNIDIWNNLESKHKELNKNAFKEIASIFKITTTELTGYCMENDYERQIAIKEKFLKNNNSLPKAILADILYVAEKLVDKL